MLTLAVAAGFLLVFVIMGMAYRALTDSENMLQGQSTYVPHASRAAPSDPIPHPFWPGFPGDTGVTSDSLVLNGVAMVNEEREAGCSTTELLAYYRDRMTGLGWQDVTEDFYGLRSPLSGRSGAGGSNEYDDRYRRIMDSNLVLTGQGWSIHFRAEPVSFFGTRSKLRIMAAATTELKDFLLGMAAIMVGDVAPKSAQLEAVQRGGGQAIRTTISKRSEDVEVAFEGALSTTSAEGWHSAMFLPGKTSRSGYFVWLVRGKEFGALSVRPRDSGHGSIVTLVVVSP
jgi:hypothetical protein